MAIDAYSYGIESIEKSREWASNDNNREEIISNAIGVYQNIIQANINLGQIDRALEFVERGKARNLVDLLATRDLYPSGDDIPKEVIERIRDLRQKIIAEEKRLQLQQISIEINFNNPDKRSFNTDASNTQKLDRTKLNQMRQELDNLVAEYIAEKYPEFQLIEKVKPISFLEIQGTLQNPQTALVEWYIGNRTLSAFIVTYSKTEPIHVSLSEKQFSKLYDSVSQYYSSYLQKDEQWRNNLSALLAKIAQNLQIKAIVKQIKYIIPDCNQLILVPHRWLHLIPIDALPLADGKCLLDLFPNGVSYAPSVQLLQLTQKQSKPSLNNLFAVQNPTEDLEFTSIEVQTIRSQFAPNDDVLVGKEASKEVLTKERLSKANSAHFSCHGYFNFENPELSALLMAGSKVDKKETQKEEEKTRFLPSREGRSLDLEKCLTLGEIFGLDLRNCRLVTLSACETGLTDFKSLSDEYIGLPSGFLFAGSPSVVSSLWKVDDLSTSFLMIKFYQNLREIDSVPLALNKAQLWLRDLTRAEFMEWSRGVLGGKQRASIVARFLNEEYPFASPYYWGAFCAVGS